MLVKFDNKYIKFGGVNVGYDSQPTPPVPTYTGYSGVLSLPKNGSFGQGFNGLGSIWSRGSQEGTEYYQDGQYGGKNCADVRSKVLSASITGSDVHFLIYNWYRTNSDFNGTANYNVMLDTDHPTFSFPNPIRNADLVAFGDYSPIYMTWSATYPVGETVKIIGKINESTQTMFTYNGGTNIQQG